MDRDKPAHDYNFYRNCDCRYFPCHEVPDTGRFSCLFCYCPLYALGDKCGGAFVYLPSGIKDCSGCTLPHVPENYGYVVNKLGELIEQVRRADAPENTQSGGERR